MKRTTKLDKIFNAYASREGVEVKDLRFTRDGEAVDPSDTPKDLALEDEDVIDVERAPRKRRRLRGPAAGIEAPRGIAGQSLLESSAMFKDIEKRLTQDVPTAILVDVLELDRPQQTAVYEAMRDNMVAPNNGGAANERLLWHGTHATPPGDVLANPLGLDPHAYSKGGFYGKGTYFSEKACYQVGGMYAYAVPGHGGSRRQLLLVKVALGRVKQFGRRVDAETRAMSQPPVLRAGPPIQRFDSVGAGPHRPHKSGPGVNDSTVYVVYQAVQAVPAYLVTFDIECL